MNRDILWVRRLLLVAILVGLSLNPHAAWAAEQKPYPKLAEVIVVLKTHFDIGYTDLAANVLDYYRTDMMDRALAVCDETRDLPPEHQFVWTVSGWPLTQILGPKQSPERRQRILDMIRNGHLVWHALPATTHTDSLELEDVVRGLGFSSQLARSLGQPLPRDAKMTDAPSHPWALPSILARAGVEFVHLGCNSASTPPDVPTLFWWEGPDGSRVMTMQSPSYGTTLVPPDNWPYTTWLALIHSGDNRGPLTAAEFRAIFDQAAGKLPGVRVRTGRLSDFADAIRKENADLPVVRADMPDTWIHGIMASPIESGLAHRVRPTIGTLESLNTLLAGWGIQVPNVKETVAAAYENSFLYGEHTWGMAVRLFGPRLYESAWQAERAKGTYAKLEESWEEHASYIRQVDKLVTPAIAAHLHALAAAVKVDGRRMVVFNPLPWIRDDMVSVRVPGVAIDGLRDTESGAAIPIEADGETVRFVARDVPAMGYRTYVPSAPATSSGSPPSFDQAGATIENASLRLRLDPATGGITSLVDKRSGRELVDHAAGGSLGQYLYERFDADNATTFMDAYNQPGRRNERAFGKPGLPPAAQAPRSAASPKDFRLTIRQGKLSITATMSAPATEPVPHAVSLAVTVYHDSPYVDLEWAVKDKQPRPWPEGGWLCFPLAVREPRFRLGRPGAIVDPAKEVCRATNREIYCLNTGLTVAGPDGFGLALCSPDAPLVSLDHPGLWRFSRDWVPARPRVYLNLFNNQWSTNFRQWIGGSWSTHVRLWLVTDGLAATQLITPSWEARMPCRAVVFDGPAGNLPPAKAGISLSRGGVLVTAFGPNPDGPGTLLRLWEQSGTDEACRVQLPEGCRPPQVQPCDLRGRPQGQPIPVRDGQFTIPMPRYAPASMLIPTGP